MTSTICKRRIITCRVLSLVLGLIIFLSGVRSGAAQAQPIPIDEMLRAARSLQASLYPASKASPNFDAAYYHLDLDIRLDPNRLVGHNHIVGRIKNRALSTLKLDFGTGHLAVDSITVDGGVRVTDFTHADDVLSIPLPQTYGPSDLVRLDVYYSGQPSRPEPGSFALGEDYAFVFDSTAAGQPNIWTLSEPYGAREWWPGKDHPGDKADSLRTTVTVPKPLRVGANGRLESTSETDSTSTFTWHSRYPIAPYLVSIAAGEYTVETQTYVRPDSLAEQYGSLELPILHYGFSSAIIERWKRVTEMLPVFEYWFGPYPFPQEKYGHAEFTWGGGMEHQTMSSMGGSNPGLVAHELAHMWYGDLITLGRWPHLWLNEGFATYGELLYWQSLEDQSSYESVFDRYWRRARDAEGALIVQDTTSLSNLFSGNRVYAKGGIVLHMLRQVVGNPTFREILRTYSAAEPHRYGNAVTSDFQAIAEEVSGQELDYFFDQWVYGEGYPDYAVNWTATPSNGEFFVTVILHQRQSAPVFEMPVPLTLETPGGSVQKTVFSDARHDTLRFSVDREPTGLTFDPERTLLRNANVPITRLPADEFDVPARLSISAFFPNPTSGQATATLALPAQGSVELDIVDSVGRRIKHITTGTMPAGYHSIPIELDGLAGGLYFIRLHTPEETDVEKFVLTP